MLAALKKVFFVEASDILRRDTTKTISILDLPEPPLRLDPRYANAGFRDLPLHSDWAFLFTCIKGIYPQALGMSLCALLKLIFDLISPQLIFHTLKTFEGIAHGSLSLSWGFMVAFLFTLNSTFQALANQHYYYYGLLGVQSCINGLSSRVYEKGLRVGFTEQRKRTLGSMANYMGSDSEAVADFLWVVVELGYTAILTILATISLWYFLGVAGVIASGVLVLLIPFSKLLGQYLTLEDHSKMRAKDNRVGLIAQIVNGINVIKLFCWESYIKGLVKEYRKKEVNIIDRINFVESVSRLMYSGISILTGFLGFSIYVSLGKELSPSVVFASLVLFRIMEHSFANLTELIAQISVSRVSANRIRDFLGSKNSQKKAFEFCHDVSISVKVQNLECAYEPKSLSVLRNINMKVLPGESVAIVGEVGSGKSALLHTLFGEMHIVKGEVVYGGRTNNSLPKVLWSGQKPFVCNLSIAENICFADEFGDLKKLLAWCGLEKDIENLNSGLKTQIGRDGLKLSGGQNQRLNLVRAAYHDAPLVILDDPFSSVDKETEQQIMDHLVCGLWKNKTRIVASHSFRHIEKFDRIIYLDKGELIAEGSLDELLEQNDSFRLFYEKSMRTRNKEKKDKHVAYSRKKNTNGLKLIEKHAAKKTEFNRLTRNTYWNYINAMTSYRLGKRTFLIFALLFSCISVSMMPLLINSWLSVWSSDTSIPESFTLIEQMLIPLKSTVSSDIFVYGVMGIIFIGLYFLHHRLWSLRSLKAGKILHENAVSGMIGSTVSFFDRNPIGQILNRFSHDFDIVEKKLPWAFEQMIRVGVAILTTIIVLFCIIPDIGFVLAPAILFYYSLQRRFRQTAMEVKRLTSVYKSPSLAHFKEMLEGLTVIRALRSEKFFRSKYHDTQKDWQKAFHAMILLNRWLSVRIPLLSSLLSFAVIIRLMYAANANELQLGTAGVVLSYTLCLWDYFNQFVRSYSESEAHMIAVERLQAFSQLEQEECDLSKGKKKTSRAKKGEVVFDEVSISYEAGRLKALENISFRVPSGKKVGIRGKSGTGKSSLIKALLRMVPHMEGLILIDGNDISRLSLQELRSAVAMVPQEPTLFAGSIRSNVDPLGQHSDDDIFKILRKCHMLDVVNERGGIEAPVLENGDNFSVGEKQLLCLARALITDCPIIVLDEATANVDGKTDFKIQETLKKHCKNKTFIIIAHRMGTLENCAQILEVKDGCLVEC